MGTLEIKKIFNNLLRDDYFGHLLAQSMAGILNISQEENDPFDSVIEYIIEHSGDSQLSGLRDKLITMFEEKQFSAFGRVLRMLQDLFGYSEARIINYLKKLRFQTRLDDESVSPWIDIRETSRAIREGLDPNKIQILARLNYEQRCLLRGFSPGQLNVMSMFSPRAISILSRITHRPEEERDMMFAFQREESELIQRLGFQRIRFLSSLHVDQRNVFLEFQSTEEVSRFFRTHSIDDKIYIDSEQLNKLKIFLDRKKTMLNSLTEETMDLAGSMCNLSDNERKTYKYLDRTEFQSLNSLNDDQINVTLQFEGQNPPLNEVLNGINSLTPQQKDAILSLRQEEIVGLVVNGYGATLSRINKLFLTSPGLIKSFSVITPQEGKAILDLSQEQRSMLSKAYLLGYDGLFMMHKLGLQLTSQVMGSIDRPSVLQMALMKKLDSINPPVNFNTTELTQLFWMMEHDEQGILINLSSRGIELLARLAEFDTGTINILTRLSSSGIEILTRNDKLTRTEILAIGNLIEREGKVVINLNTNQREYLFSKRDLTQLDFPLFSEHEQEVLEKLSQPGRKVLSRIISLSTNSTEADRTFLRRMSVGERNHFATLTRDQVSLLSSFMVWDIGEDLVFTLLGMEFDVSPNRRIVQISQYLNRVSLLRENAEDDYLFKLIASTIEMIRLTGVMGNEDIENLGRMIEQIYGINYSLIFKLEMLSISMRDSNSLESLLVSKIITDQVTTNPICRTNEIHTIEDVLFIRWIMSQPPDLNGGIFHRFASTALFRLPIQRPAPEFETMLLESTSRLDGIPRYRVLNGFRQMLKAERYALAIHFFLGTPCEESGPMISSLVEILSSGDCFEFLKTPIQPSWSRNNGSRFINPSVFEVALSHGRSDHQPLLEILDGAQLWELLERHSLASVELMVNNHQTDLLQLFENVGNMNQLMKENRQAFIDNLMQDSPIEECYEVGDTLRYLAYVGAFIGKVAYIRMSSEYVISLRRRLKWGDLERLLDSFVTDEVHRRDLIPPLEARLDPELSSFLGGNEYRNCKRVTDMICVDSGNIEPITTEEHWRIIRNTFVSSQVKKLEFYDELLKYSEGKLDRGTFVTNMKKVPLKLMDAWTEKVILGVPDEILKQSGIIKRINELASITGFTFTMFIVGEHSVAKNVKNLWVMPEIRQRMTEKLTNLAAMPEGSASAIGAAVGDLAGLIGLVEDDLNIVTDSVFVAVNMSAVVTRIDSTLGGEVSVMGESTVPLRFTLSAGIIVASYPMNWKIDKVEEHIKLTAQGNRSLHWHSSWDESIRISQIDLTARNIHARYSSQVLQRFQGEYDQIGISLPRFLITNKECIPDRSRRRRRGILCRLGEKNTAYQSDFSHQAFAWKPFSVDHGNRNSTPIPNYLEGYDIVCGPSVDDATERVVNSTIDSPYLDTRWKVQVKEFFLLPKPNEDCANIVTYRRRGVSNSTKVLFYVAQDTFIILSPRYSIDMIFYGKKITITDNEGETHMPGEISQNRYYFQNELSDCRINKSGHNYFYLRTGRELKCDFARLDQQHNIVVVANNFTDSEGIHSIVGSDQRDKIEASFAEYVDGKGGGDIIHATKRTIVKGYLHDFIVGKCLVLLPLNVSDIDSLLVKTQMSIWNKEGSSLVVDGNIPLITADRYLLTPIRISDITHKVTHAHIRKSREDKISLEDELTRIREIQILNCTLVKQLSSANLDIILSDLGRNIFYADKPHHEFYWESSDEQVNLYILRKLFVNVTISKANGIIDFQDLNIQFDPDKDFFNWNREDKIDITIGGLYVILLPNRKHVTVTFDGKKYFQLGDKEIIPNYCFHSLPIVDRMEVKGTDLYNYPTCFEFDFNKILFLKLDDDLILVSGRRVLIISEYYTTVYGKIDLSVKLTDRILGPQIFQERANDPRQLVYYNVSGSGLKIYHNQPIDKHHIGFIDIKDKSIKDFQMIINNRNLLMVNQNFTIVQIENWESYRPSRELMFAFKDSFIPNAECIVNNCKPGNIIKEFQIIKTRMSRSRPKRHSSNNASCRSSWINNLVIAIKKPIMNSFKLLTNYYEPETIHDEQFCMTGNVYFGWCLLQHFLHQKYPLVKPRATTPEEILMDVIDLTEEFQRILNDTARQFDIESRNVDSFELYSNILDLAKQENYQRIQELLCLVGEKVCSRDETFLTELRINIKHMFNS